MGSDEAGNLELRRDGESPNELGNCALPFDRYEHRRLGPRDLMVHRIMADIMKPARVQARTYDTPVAHPSEFDPIKAQDRRLGLDLQVVRKMLVTSFPGPPDENYRVAPAPGSQIYHFCTCSDDNWQSFRIPLPSPPTLGDEVLDLVQRHYLEADDAALRLLLDCVRPPRRQMGPRTDRAVDDPRSRGSMMRALDQLRTDHQAWTRKQWRPADMEHLRGFQSQTAVQDRYPLYDGGAFLPALRGRLDRLDEGGLMGFRAGETLLRCTMPLPQRQDELQSLWQRVGGGPPYLIQVPRKPCKGHPPDPLPVATGKLLSGRGRRLYNQPHRRSASEPPLGSFSVATLPFPPGNKQESWMLVVYPRMTVSQLDRRSRRRSFDRSHVADMFRGLAGGDVQPEESSPGSVPLPETAVSPENGRARKPRHPAPCDNCRKSHATPLCTAPCGHCGAPNPGPPTVTRGTEPRTPARWEAPAGGSNRQMYFISGAGLHNQPHTAPTCPVPRRARCKCGPFPTFHVAARCPVTCSRCPLSEKKAPGHFSHRNAMTCRARCCMCGLLGHAGRECRLAVCRCGGHHLGQDCTWKVECAVAGCRRFLCGVHCRGCGSTERPFFDWKCVRCGGRGERTTKKEEKRELGIVDPGSTPAATPKGATPKGKKRRERRKKDTNTVAVANGPDKVPVLRRPPSSIFGPPP